MRRLLDFGVIERLKSSRRYRLAKNFEAVLDDLAVKLGAARVETLQIERRRDERRQHLEKRMLWSNNKAGATTTAKAPQDETSQ